MLYSLEISPLSTTTGIKQNTKHMYITICVFKNGKIHITWIHIEGILK